MFSDLTNQQVIQFQDFIRRWYLKHGRHQLPWRQTTDPYAIHVSEIMLQQTQVERVIPKYLAFLEKFPTVFELAAASQAEVISLWQGLGYNRRGLNLHKAAQYLVEHHRGHMPQSTEKLLAIPGIGPYTAAAIQTFAFNLPVVVIETNIRTIYLYHFFPDQENVPDPQLLPLIESTLANKSPREWYSALMDYGTFLKSVLPNPTRRSKHYTKQSKFAGSLRQVRGQIIKHLTLRDQIPYNQLRELIEGDKQKFQQALEQLQTEGFVAGTDQLKLKS